MTSKEALAPGDLVLVPFPYTDLSATKTRPALVLSPRHLNQGPDVVVCAMTSNLANADASVLLEPGDLASGRLPRASRAKVTKLATLQQSMVRRRFGRLKPAPMDQVRKELRVALDL
ncbi:MAG: type II toxin-antitoxin system PemK/MazF family toxin [Thermoplasmatota archaeon]